MNTFDADSEAIRQFWNGRYREEGFIWGRGPSPCAEATLPFFKARSARRLLDLGCGYGRDVVYFGRLELDAVGVDVAEMGLEIGTTWAQQEGVTVSFEHAATENLPYENSAFDGIISHRTLHLILSPERRDLVIREAHRVLRPKGVLGLAARCLKDPTLHAVAGGVSEVAVRLGHRVHAVTEDELSRLLEGRFAVLGLKELREPETARSESSTVLVYVVAERI